MPLLGANGQPIPAEPGPEAVADAHAALEDGTAEAVAPEPLPCITAFIIYQLPDGRWQVSTDLDAPLVPERQAHGDDFTSGCATTLRDVQTQETAVAVTNMAGPAIVQNVLNNLPQAMMQLGNAVRQQGEAAAIAAKLEKDKHVRGGR